VRQEEDLTAVAITLVPSTRRLRRGQPLWHLVPLAMTLIEVTLDGNVTAPASLVPVVVILTAWPPDAVESVIMDEPDGRAICSASREATKEAVAKDRHTPSPPIRAKATTKIARWVRRKLNLLVIDLRREGAVFLGIFFFKSLFTGHTRLILTVIKLPRFSYTCQWNFIGCGQVLELFCAVYQ
jgi:hypothetical protein